MSGKTKPAPARPRAPGRRPDRRVRRTRDRLGDALVALMHEKPFDAITVGEVLERARVGRSTFYAHFRDKNDLFLSDADDFFGKIASHLSRRAPGSNRVAPVAEFFAHVADARAFHSAVGAAGRLLEVMELGRRHFARGIERRFAELRRPAGLSKRERAARAHALSGAMVALLGWWLEEGQPFTPDEVDAVFHRLAWGVAAP